MKILPEDFRRPCAMEMMVFRFVSSSSSRKQRDAFFFPFFFFFFYFSSLPSNLSPGRNDGNLEIPIGNVDEPRR